MRRIISNTTPILSLLKIGKLYLLKELYGKIIVPFAVYQEIEKGTWLSPKLISKALKIADEE
ncbi:MAG: hypothetical protein GXO81_07065 [Chlorobi bacterium]|nr:hypothetical protein [Chlorobiota bacterium]